MLCATLVLGAGKEPTCPNRDWINPVDGMRFAWIPETPETAAGEAGPKANGRLGFWMARTEVTVAQFARFIRKTGYLADAERANQRWTWKRPGFKQRSSQPVVWVTASDALAYARWAGTDLPTEGEWLKAARGNATTRYPWGDELDSGSLWHRGNAAGGSKPVARKRPNEFGLHDMLGNAAEYCRIAECEPDHQCYASRGSSWSRCESYLTRQGTLAADLIARTVAPEPSHCVHKTGQEPYPFDDDRGFRCVKRP
jgi:formylglycine-generating enzyme required for sulfatase activity